MADDAKEILVNGLNKTLSQAVKSMSKVSSNYLRDYGKKMNRFLALSPIKQKLALGAERMSMDNLSIHLRSEMDKKYKGFVMGKIPIMCKDGKTRYYKPDPWCRMMARTRSRDIRETGLHNEMAKAGLDLVMVSVGGSGDPCKNWEGRVLSISGQTPGYHLVSDVRATGELFHPNCIHHTSIFMLYKDDTGEIGVLGRNLDDWKMVKNKYGIAITGLKKKFLGQSKQIARMPFKSSILNEAEKQALKLKKLDECNDVKGIHGWCKEYYPDIETDFLGCDIGLLKPVLKQFDKLSADFPSVTKRLEYIGTYAKSTKYKVRRTGAQFKENEWAHSSKDGKNIDLNPAYFKDEKALLKSLQETVDGNWHPSGLNTPESIMSHEFGHQVNNFLLSKYLAITSFVGLDKVGLVSKGKTDFRDKNYRIARNVSNYALESESEAFAEAFAAHYHQAYKQKAIYTKRMKKFLELYADEKTWKTGAVWKWSDNIEHDEKLWAIFQKERRELLKKHKEIDL